MLLLVQVGWDLSGKFWRGKFTQNIQKGKKGKLLFLPIYISGEGTDRLGYRGHGDADWRKQVEEGLKDMKV